MEKDFDFSRVPKGFQLCFNKKCPKQKECLRALAAQHVPEDMLWGAAVYPTALREDGQCPMFRTTEAKRMAWGFSKLFADVLQRDNGHLRYTLMEYLGGRTNYYRYNRGDKLLTEEQQKYILKIFRQQGYKQPLEFDGYASVYDFKGGK